MKDKNRYYKSRYFVMGPDNIWIQTDSWFYEITSNNEIRLFGKNGKLKISYPPGKGMNDANEAARIASDRRNYKEVIKEELPF